MRTVPAAITTARQSNSSRLCKIWRVTRTDGVVLRFTEHDRDLVIGGDTYYATASFDASSIKASGDLSIDDLDVQGAFDSDYIRAEDVLAGKYNGATFVVAEVLWDNLAPGEDVLRWGWLGRVREVGGAFVAELLGPTVRLNKPLLQTYQPSCRAVLGDSRCGVSLAAHTQSGTVLTVTNRRTFTVSGVSVPSGDDTYFQGGLLTFTSTGDLEGVSMEVQDFDGTTVDLILSVPFDIQAGDTFDIVAGCDHSLATCRDRFDNVLNFRGEPHAPVSDDTMRGPTR